MSNPEIKTLVETFVTRLDGLVRAAALAAVTEAFSAPKAAPSAAKKPAPSKPAAKKPAAKKPAAKKPAAKKPAPSKPAAAKPVAAAAAKAPAAKPAAEPPPAANTIAALAILAKKPAAAKPAAAKPAAAKPAAAKPAAAKPAAAKPATAKRVRRSPADLDRDVGRLVAHVKTNPGATTEKLRAALGVEREAWKSTVTRAIETKQLERRGERRDATLHLAKTK